MVKPFFAGKTEILWIVTMVRNDCRSTSPAALPFKSYPHPDQTFISMLKHKTSNAL